MEYIVYGSHQVGHKMRWLIRRHCNFAFIEERFVEKAGGVTGLSQVELSDMQDVYTFIVRKESCIPM